jgi:hypothetical protein
MNFFILSVKYFTHFDRFLNHAAERGRMERPYVKYRLKRRRFADLAS